jgi:hypothetical protein
MQSSSCRFESHPQITPILFFVICGFVLFGDLSAQSLAPPAPNATRHNITPEDVLSIRELYDVRLSPTGKKIAFLVS